MISNIGIPPLGLEPFRAGPSMASQWDNVSRLAVVSLDTTQPPGYSCDR